MQELLSDYLAAHKELFQSLTTVGMFRLAAQWYPDKDAVVANESHMKYRTLDMVSDRLAYFLTEHEHIGHGDVVGVATDRSVCATAIIIGIWKTGAAFVMLDPSMPEAHNQKCIESGHVRVCVDYDYFISAVSSYGDDCGRAAFQDRSRPEQLALILFTSGSTGAPKGVRLLHSNITASVSNFDCLPLRSDDRFATLSRMLFIAAIYDISASFSLGCTLQILPERILKNIREIAGFYIKNQCTVAFLPPHMASKYVEIDEDSPLRILLVGSEPCRNLKKRPYEIINVYASSEACAIVSHYTIQDARVTYPIGKLVPALRGYIVGEDGKLAPPGEEGELWLSGPQIFDGYVDLPEVNARQFAPNPFEQADPRFSRVFKTSDVVRLLPDGDMEYIDRKDNMYKIRGFRVEACGVEAHMLEFPQVTGACVTCFTDAGGTNILFGYFTADEEIDHERFREFLAKRLPRYAIPTGLVQVDQFPRTLSKKVNRHGFPAPPELNDHKKLEVLYY